MSTSHLHIIAAGLLKPPSDLEDRSRLRPPVLEKLLGWSSKQPAADDYSRQLVQLAGLADGAPIAPCALLGEGLEPADDIWMLASPVHMKADLHNLLLFDGRYLEIDADEADSLVVAFNDHFADRGMELLAPHPQRWYLRLARQPRIETFPLERAAGRSPADFLPKGEDAGDWQALLTEVQMLFHGCEANRQRAAAGRPSINGIWVHGAGRLPEAPAHPHLKWVVGGEVLGTGIARLAGAHPKEWKQPPADGELRLFDDFRAAVDLHDWHQALDRFEGWLDQAFDWLAERRNRTILLYPCQGSLFRLESKRIARFWHRPKPFSRYLEE